MSTSGAPFDTEVAVRDRYRRGASDVQPALCCPVEYDPRYLEVIPAEVIERDYGCGDPSRHLHPGETVLDLGSGTGKICFIAAQVVGPSGRVIGIDMTSEMLEVARVAAPQVAKRLGYSNVEFRRGRIQDLALDLEALEDRLARRPVGTVDALSELERFSAELRRERPLVSDQEVDVVVSNCVLNLVDPADRLRLFEEIHRVLRPGGRAVISDIVSDEPVTEAMRSDPDLWSGCVAGAMTEAGFIEAFERAGFVGVRIVDREADPWQTFEGIEFRSITVEALRGPDGPCLERNQAVIYRGPFREILDDEGHRMQRGRRYAVCDRTFRLLQREPYAGLFDAIEPRTTVPVEDAQPFDCSRAPLRDPRETKGVAYRVTLPPEGPACGPEGCC